MKIEKINENKIKITFTKQDLIEKNIDLNAFTQHTIDSQDIVFDLLQEVESSYDFDLSTSQLAIEGIGTSNGGMILTITKINLGTEKTIKPAGLKAKRKFPTKDSENLVYSFDSFDTFAEFAGLFKALPTKYINTLYEYNNIYFWSISNLNQNERLYKKIAFKLSDYANFVPSETIINKLNECGTIIIKDRAIQIINKKYIKQQKID